MLIESTREKRIRSNMLRAFLYRNITKALHSSDFVFRYKVNVVMDTLIQQTYYLIIEIHNFRGDITDVLAQTKTPLRSISTRMFPVR